jgi:plastocyanin
MKMRTMRWVREPSVHAAILAALLPFIASVAWAAATSPEYVISQLGRTFRPSEVTIKRGETIEVVNDDGDLLHHVYVESDKFNFDSGDQNPGSRTSISFPVSGNFTLLCAIHPKMKLVVHVQ